MVLRRRSAASFRPSLGRRPGGVRVVDRSPVEQSDWFSWWTGQWGRTTSACTRREAVAALDDVDLARLAQFAASLTDELRTEQERRRRGLRT